MNLNFIKNINILTIPTKVAKKKLIALTLKIQGKTLEIANGIPPTKR